MRVLMLPLAAMLPMAAAREGFWVNRRYCRDGPKCGEGEGDCNFRKGEDECGFAVEGGEQLVCGHKNCLNGFPDIRTASEAKQLGYTAGHDCCQRKPDPCADGSLNDKDETCTCTSTSPSAVYALCKKGFRCDQSKTEKAELCSRPTCEHNQKVGIDEPGCTCKQARGSEQATCSPGWTCDVNATRSRHLCVTPTCDVGVEAARYCVCKDAGTTGGRQRKCDAGETCKSDGTCDPAPCTLTDRNSEWGGCTCVLEGGKNDVNAPVCWHDDVCVGKPGEPSMPQCTKKIDYETREINQRSTHHHDLDSCQAECTAMVELAYSRNILRTICNMATTSTNDTEAFDFYKCHLYCLSVYDPSFDSKLDDDKIYHMQCVGKIQTQLINTFGCEKKNLCVKPVAPSPPPAESGSKTTTLLAIGGVVLGGGLIFFVYMNRNIFFKKNSGVKRKIFVSSQWHHHPH